MNGVSFECVVFLRALWSVSCCALDLCSASFTVGARFYLELPAVSLMAHTCRGSDRRTCAFEFTRTRERSASFSGFQWNEVSFGCFLVGSQEGVRKKGNFFQRHRSWRTSQLRRNKEPRFVELAQSATDNAHANSLTETLSKTISHRS